MSIQGTPMRERPKHSVQVMPQYLLGASPGSIPNLVSFWRFNESGKHFQATQGLPYQLSSQRGHIGVDTDQQNPFGGNALRLHEGDWLACPRSQCPELDFHGDKSPHTVIAWVKRDRKSKTECEFIAGQWNETNFGRQYGLFIDIQVWQEANQVCGHLSNTGGPSIGYKYCVDGPVGQTPVPWGEWSVIAMSYDNTQGYVWLNGQLDHRPTLNPYPMHGGLHNGGPNGSDFTVGAVHRGGQIGNFFCGWIAGLAVYSRALTPSEIYALSIKPQP